MSTLYERIIEMCKKKGVSGSRMCLDLGMSKSTMSELKAGRTKGISTATAQKFASYLGVSVDYLLGEETNEKEPTVTEDGELEENIIIFHRDGKTQKKKFTAEQMAMFMAMVDAIPDTPKDDI